MNPEHKPLKEVQGWSRNAYMVSCRFLLQGVWKFWNARGCGHPGVAPLGSDIRGPKGHINIRSLQHMISGILPRGSKYLNYEYLNQTISIIPYIETQSLHYIGTWSQKVGTSPSTNKGNPARILRHLCSNHITYKDPAFRLRRQRQRGPETMVCRIFTFTLCFGARPYLEVHWTYSHDVQVVL